jgi:RHS repeat-associated protein
VVFAYDTANRRTSLTLPNGVNMSYGYDSASEVSGINYTLGSNTLGNLTYAYDLAGRRVSMGGSYAVTGLPQPISNTGYDAANELTKWGTATPTYDSNGNVLSDGTNSYAWDARNHLVSMNSGSAGFQYDPFGRRVAKTVLLTTTNYLYDRSNPVQELAGTTPTANLLTGGLDQYFERTDSNGAANFLTDALGSTLALTDPNGNTLAQYTYAPFGNTTITGSSANPYQYTGRENDGTGVYFYRARYYNPLLSRFISQDPIGLAAGVNVYAYVAGAPIANVDPFGLSARGHDPSSSPASPNKNDKNDDNNNKGKPKCGDQGQYNQAAQNAVFAYGNSLINVTSGLQVGPNNGGSIKVSPYPGSVGGIPEPEPIDIWKTGNDIADNLETVQNGQNMGQAIANAINNGTGGCAAQ